MNKALLLRLYREKAVLRIIVQALLIVIIYFVIRSWQTRDYVEGGAPNISTKLLSGEVFELEKQQKPLLIHFWASWCPICELEHSSIQSLADDYSVVTIASWSGDADEVGSYLEQQGLNMPVIVDEDGELARLYGVKAVPASFFVDVGKKIRMVERGYTTETGMRLRLWWLENR